MKKEQLVKIIQNVVRREVKKQVNEILIKEQRTSAVSSKKSKPIRKPVRKKKEKHYTSNETLNQILNETVGGLGGNSGGGNGEFDEYPDLGGGTFDSSKMAQAMGYGNAVGNAESRRKAAAIETAQAAGADTSNKAVQDVMGDLTKDYSGVMKALKKRDNK